MGRATVIGVTAVLVGACVLAATLPKASSIGPVAEPLSLNRASAVELELIPGIGRALADRIVRDREQNGPFIRVQDVDRVRGVGPAMLERLSTHTVP
ncbi:MAG: helix-hairpin-helix domain-containing protein [Phycisphaerae bacterium]|nr:helix-hairpin-helix domain-containing protein [Phycisphaerae bacterium]